MALILPLAVFFMLWRIFVCCTNGLREALLRAAVISITLLAVMTELLSIPYLLTRISLIVTWTIVALLTFVVFQRYARRPVKQRDAPLFSDFTLLERLLLAGIGIDLAFILLVALVAPPNTSDVVEYHMPRVMFWVSNHTLRVYPTADYAQLIQATGAEFVALHSYLLWGSDRLANLTEFFSLVGSAIAASLIAEKFGAKRTGQLLAALFVVTIPEAVLESSGSMTTIVVSFWIIVACYFLLQAGETLLEWDVLIAALACGLAILTKGIAFLYLPFLVLACIALRSGAARLWLLKRLPLVALIALTLSAGQFVRAYQVTGTPLGAPFPAGGPRLNFATNHITPGTIIASVIRHTTLQTETPVSKLNGVQEKLARKVMRLFGQNPDDPQQVWVGYSYFIDHPTRLETQCGNPVHFIILLLCFIAAVALRRRFSPGLLWYATGIVLAFVMFCALIRWQPWGSRFHMPLFVVAAAIVGVVLDPVLRHRWQVACLAGLMLIVALPYLLLNSPRSILHSRGFATIFQPRSVLLVADHHVNLASDFAQTAAAVRATKCGSVAIDAYIPMPDDQIVDSPLGFEVYPLLAQIQIDGQSRTAHYIAVNNPTKNFPTGQHSGPECVIVCLSCTLSNGRKSYAHLGRTATYGINEVTVLSASAVGPGKAD